MSDIKTKFINDPEQITPELLEGYVLAYPCLLYTSDAADE